MELPPLEEVAVLYAGSEAFATPGITLVAIRRDLVGPEREHTLN